MGLFLAVERSFSPFCFTSCHLLSADQILTCFGIYLTLVDTNFFLLLLLTLMSWRHTIDNVVSLRDLLNASCSVSREEQ